MTSERVEKQELPKGYFLDRDGDQLILMRQGWQRGVIFFDQESAISYANFLERDFYKKTAEE